MAWYNPASWFSKSPEQRERKRFEKDLGYVIHTIASQITDGLIKVRLPEQDKRTTSSVLMYEI